MNKIIIAIVVVAIVLVGGYLLLKNQQPSAPSFNLPLAEETPEETLPANLNAVIYNEDGYSPSTLRVAMGTTVVFENASSQSMWTASDAHPTHRLYDGTSLDEHCGNGGEAASFDACAGTQPGNSWEFKFDKKGVWKYHNHLNPSHTGAITVE